MTYSFIEYSTKLLELHNLPQNWCYEYDIPPTLNSILHASFWAGYCNAQNFEVEFIPTGNGGITLTEALFKYSFSIELLNTDIISYTEEVGIGFKYDVSLYLEKPGIQDVYDKLLTFRKRYGILL